MFIPKHWSRAAQDSRACLGWSDVSAADAEKLARARLARLLALGDDPAPDDWEYYPSTPMREEILETPRIVGATAVITRNRSGAKILNVDRVAFVDVDLRTRNPSLLGSIGALFRKKTPAPDPEQAAALARAREWAESRSARLRAYRTAGGLRLLRIDKLLDPDGEECAQMFAALGADPQYGRLCRIQKSFRARLTPKPRRVDCASAPGSHPRTDADSLQSFRAWLENYERACVGRSVCAFVDEYGSAQAVAPPQVIVGLHDRSTVQDGGTLS